MFAAERILKIKQLLFEYKKMDVSTLSSILSVSAVTVRKDLDKLQKEGFLIKTHGGVFLSQDAQSNEYISNIEDGDFSREDEEIGLLAAKLVNNHDVVFLSGGYICLSIAKNLKTKNNLTIVTNNQDIVYELSPINDIRVIAVGGEVITYKNSIMTQGNIALSSISNYNFSKAFLNVEGITIKEGYTVHTEFESTFYDAILDKTKEAYIVADHTKFGDVDLYNFGDLSKVKKIVSDSDLDNKHKKYLGENDFTLYTTFSNF